MQGAKGGSDVFSQAPDELLVYLCHFCPAKDIAGTISRLSQRLVWFSLLYYPNHQKMAHHRRGRSIIS